MNDEDERDDGREEGKGMIKGKSKKQIINRIKLDKRPCMGYNGEG